MTFLLPPGIKGLRVKAAATHMRYLARSKFLWSFVHKKDFCLIWRVDFNLEYLFCQGRQDTFSDFEWTWRKVTSDNYSREYCKQAIIKLLLAYNFGEIFIICQNLNIFFSWNIDPLLINSKLNSYSVCTCRGVNLDRFMKKRPYYYVLMFFFLTNALFWRHSLFNV